MALAKQNIDDDKKISNKSSSTRTGTRTSTPVARDTTNEFNLAGTNNIQSARGTPKTIQQSGPTGLNTDAFNLAGTNNIRNAGGSVRNTNKVYNDVYTSEPKSSVINPIVAKNNLKSIQPALSQMSDESTRKANNLINAIADTKNKISNAVDNFFDVGKQNQEYYNQQRQERFEKSREKSYQEQDKIRNEYVQSLLQDSPDKYYNQDGSPIDFEGQIKNLNGQKATLESIIDTAETDVQKSSAQADLDGVITKLNELNLLKAKRDAYEEAYNLETLKNSGDEQAYRNYREMISHRNDNMLQRIGSATSHLLTQTLNEIPSVIDQAIYRLDYAVANQGIDGLKLAHENGEIDTDTYVEALSEIDSRIKQAQERYNDSTSQEIRKVAEQYSANTFYGTDDIEQFLLQAGESTAQFMLHYAIGVGVASSLSASAGIEAIRELGGSIATVTMSGISATEKTNQLLQEGYDIDTAYRNGLFSGLVSYATEKVGMDRFVEMLGTPVSSNIMGQILVRNLNSSVSEGLEEVVEGLIDPLVDSIILGKDYEVNGSELFTSFLLGGTSGLAMATGATANAIINNPVGRIIVENRQQRQMLLNEVQTLNEYLPSMTDEQKAIAQELIKDGERAINDYDAKSMTLGVTFSSDNVEPITAEEADRVVIDTLQPNFNNEIQNTNTLNNLQNRINEDVDQIISAENNVINRTQELLIDSGYNIDARVFNNLDTQRQNDALVALDFAKLMGLDVSVTDESGIRNALEQYGFKGDEAKLQRIIQGANGFVTPDGQIIINGSNTKNPILNTLAHELTHGTESSQFYSQLRDLVKRSFGNEWENALQQKIEDYKDIENFDAEKEVVARFLEDKLGDEQFIDDLIKYNYSLGSKIWQDLKAIGNTDEVVRLRNAFEKAFADAQMKDLVAKDSMQFSAGGTTGLSALMNSKDPKLQALGKDLSEKLDEAIRLDQEGLNTEWMIWEKTGWIKKADGLWRFQFYDGADETATKLISMLSHADGKIVGYLLDEHFPITRLIDKNNVLFKMYPELKDITISFYADNSERNTLGVFRSGEDLGDGYRISPSISFNLAKYRYGNGFLNFGYEAYDQIADTFFHELQHAIQEAEGFEDGSNLQIGAKEYTNNISREAKEDVERLTTELKDSGLTEKQINNALMDLRNDYTIRKELREQLNEEQRRMLRDLIRAYDDVNLTSAPYDKAYDIYQNNQGEIEAREEARRALFEKDRKIAPRADGRLKPKYLGGNATRELAFVNDKGEVISFSDEELQNNRNDVLKLSPIEIEDKYGLSTKDGRPLKQKVLDFFNDVYNGEVEAGVVGTVIIDNRGVKNDLNHGISSLKSKAFVGVPEVLKNGLVTDLKNNYQGKAEDRVIVSAPVKIDGVDYVENVILRQTGGRKKGEKKTKLYLHDVVLINKESGKMTFIDPDLNISGETEMPGSWPSKTTSKFNFSYNPQNVNNDSQGRALTKQQQNYFKESKIRDKNGNLLVVYHGTDANFNEFNMKDFGIDGETAEGFGIYLTDNPRVANAYGDRSIKAYANIKNPATSFRQDINQNTLEKLIKATVENEAKQLVENGDYDTVDEAIRDTWISNYTNTYDKSMKDNYRDVAESIIRMNDNDMNIIQEVMSGLGARNYQEAYDFYDILKKVTGIDGFETEWNANDGTKSRIFLAFDSNQVKNIDNTSPTDSPDIRFSLEAKDSMGRDLSKEQQDFFKDSKVRDEDGNLKPMYHGTRGDFTVFDLGQGGQSNYKAGIGFWFTPSKQGAINFANNIWYGDGKEKAMEVYLNITNPYVYEEIDNADLLDSLDKQMDDIDKEIADIKKTTNFIMMDDVENRYYVNTLPNPVERMVENGFKEEEARTYVEQYLRIKELQQLQKQLKEEYYNNRYTDPYEQFRTDIYKIAGQTADEANTGGIGMGLNNPRETLQKYRNNLIEQGYDGIIIKDTRFDSESFGGNNDQYVAFFPSQIKNVDNLNPTENQDIRFSLGKQDTQESVQDESDRSKYFDYGMNPVRDVDILKQTEAGPTSRFWNNLANSQYVSDEEAQRIQKMVQDGLGAYEKTSRKIQDREAKNTLRQMGMENAFKYMMNTDSIDTMSVDNALGRVLLSEMNQKGLAGTENYHQLEARLQWRATMQGQALEAWKGFRDSTPEGQVVTIRSEIERIQQGLNERYGEGAYNVQLDEDLIDEYLRARTNEERENIRIELAKQVAKQIPPTAMEQINSFRHLSMLFNPRTWIKNSLANKAMGYINEGTRAVRSILESIAYEKGKNNENSVFYGMEKEAGTYNPFSKKDKEQFKRFKEQYNTEFKNKIDMKYSAIDAGNILLGTGFGEEVSRYRDAFTSKFLNKLSETNAKMMSDAPGMSTAYAKSMVGYLKANGLDYNTMNAEQIKKAQDFAINEAKYATFNSYNELASDIARFSSNGGIGRRIFIESFLPFKRTPFNLLKTGFRYTPVGLAETMTNGFAQLKKGNITANEWINNVAQGITGSGLMALGALLAHAGIFRTKDDDKDRKQYYDQDLGEQEYSLNWDGGSYTIDWLDPMIVPMAMGAELVKYVQNGEYSLDEMINLISSLADPMFETSMLSGIQKNLSNYSQGITQWWGKIAQNALTNYVQQYIPSIFGATARTIDDTRRSTYTDRGALAKAYKQALNKIPGASMFNEPYVNRKGQAEKNQGNNIVDRAILNFLSPGYYSSKDIDEYDEEMYRLYEQTGDIDSLPSSANSSLKYEGENYKFSPKQYTQWQQTRWQTESEYVNQFMDSQVYQQLSDAERVETIKDIRSYAQKVAKQQFLASQGVDYEDKSLNDAQGAMDYGIELYAYYDYLNNAGSKQADKIAYLEKSNLSQSQKEYLWGLNDYKTSYQDAYEKIFGNEDSNNKTSKKKSSNGKRGSATSSGKKVSAGAITGKSGGNPGSVSGGGISRAGRVNMVGKGNANVARKEESDIVNSYLKAYSSSMGTGNRTIGGSTGNTVVCPRCGNKVSSASGRCPICGANL